MIYQNTGIQKIKKPIKILLFDKNGGKFIKNAIKIK
jgi:hypothetical protein